jgi:hypothetical protein
MKDFVGGKGFVHFIAPSSMKCNKEAQALAFSVLGKSPEFHLTGRF